MNRNITLLFALSFVSLVSFAQGGQWEWVNGSNTPNEPAQFGAKGVPGPNNTPQGLCGSAYWSDLQGNFWIFGGFDEDNNVPCAMWKFDPAIKEWAWMSGTQGIQDQGVAGPGAPVYGTLGVAADSNFPGARVWATQWTDNNGNLWLFGGSGWGITGAGRIYNDLWEYNTSTNLWTWISGSNQSDATDVYGTYQVPSDTTMPGGRYAAGSSWTDANNNLWFFGGVEVNDSSYNDMWRYNISTNQWTWMKGPQIAGNAGNYGTIGVESVSNLPPHRTTFTRWKDSVGNFYLWGGGDFWIGEPYNLNLYSDVWKYNIATNNWVWVAGENTGGTDGVYNQYCVNNGNTGPRCRTFNSTPDALSSTGAFIAYAGRSLDSNNVALDDLWLFNSANNQWRWIGGKEGAGAAGTYGTFGTPSSSNLPPSRFESCMWIDCSGSLWVFGGQGNTAYNMFNDVWEYIPDTSCTGIPLVNGGVPATFQLSSDSICAGGKALLSISGFTNPSVTPSASVTWQNASSAYLQPDSTTNYILTGLTSCNVSDTISFTINVGSGGGTAQISANPPQFCPNDSTTICAPSGFASYNWSNGQSGQCITTSNPGDYYVTVASAGGCSAVSNHVNVTTYSSPSVSTSVKGDTLYAYNANAYQWFLNGAILTGDTDSVLIAPQAGTYTVAITDSNGCTATSNGLVITGIGSIADLFGLKVYPDPATDELNISYTLSNASPLQINITDLTGRVVENALNEKEANGAYMHRFNIAQLAAGAYLLNLKSENNDVYLRFVKQ